MSIMIVKNQERLVKLEKQESISFKTISQKKLKVKVRRVKIINMEKKAKRLVKRQLCKFIWLMQKPNSEKKGKFKFTPKR